MTRKKQPYMQWFTRDWLGDPAVSKCSPATRGIWVDILNGMHELDHCGRLTGSREELARLARCTVTEFGQAIEELRQTRTAEVTLRDDAVTIINRRMRAEWTERKQCAERVAKHRRRVACNGNVTASKNIGQQFDTRSVTDGQREGNASVTPALSYASSSSEKTFPPVFPPDGGNSPRRKHGDHVFLTEEEFRDLVRRFGENGALHWIGCLDGYARQIGAVKFKRRYASHYDTIINWHRRENGGGDVSGSVLPAERIPAPVNGDAEHAAAEHRARLAEYRARLTERNADVQMHFRKTVITPLRDELSERSWEQWIEPLLVASADGNGGCVVLFHEQAQWVEDNYRERITRLMPGKMVRFTGEYGA